MYIVNKWGVVHLVADRLLQRDERSATPEEIAAYEAFTPKTAVEAKQSLEVANAIAERDQEIEKLKVELASKEKKK